MDIRNARSKFSEALQQAAVGEHGTMLNPSSAPRNDASANVNQGLAPSRGGRRARLLAAKALERPGVIRLYERRIDLAQFMHEESPSLYELVRVWLTDVGQITQSAGEFLDENSASLASVSDPLFACVKPFTARHFDSPMSASAARLARSRSRPEGSEETSEGDAIAKTEDASQDTPSEPQSELQIGVSGDTDQMLELLMKHLAHWKGVKAKYKRSYDEFVEANYENFRAIDECAARKRANLAPN